MNNEELCPCKSGKTFGECCGPVIAGTAKAETAEALISSNNAEAKCSRFLLWMAFLQRPLLII